QPEQAELQVDEVELVEITAVGECIVDLGAHVLQTVVVEPFDDDRTQHCAPYVAHATEDHGAQHDDREGEDERVDVDRADDGCVERSTDAAGYGTDRIRPQLGAHQRNPHQAGRQFVLPDGHPGATETAIAKLDRHPYEKPAERKDHVVLRPVVTDPYGLGYSGDLVEKAHSNVVDGSNSLRPVGQVEVAGGNVVAV